MSDTLIKVEGVSKKFCRSLKKSLWYGIQDLGSELQGKRHGGANELRTDEFWAVKDVSFELKRGECLGLIGHNGAGKSTLLKLLNGLIKPDAGQVEINGRVGALIELGAGFNPILSGRENIYVNGSVLGFTKAEIDRKLDEIIAFAEIEEFIDSPVQNYSSGMKVRLGFAVAAQMEPDVLIIDEVLSVGDIGFRAKCFNAIYRMMQKSAVIFVSHAMSQISRICTDLIVMDKGIACYKGKDIGNGIDLYYTYFRPEDRSILTGGSGKAEVKKIILFNSQDKNISEINFGEDLSILLECSINVEIERPSISIAIATQELLEVAQCSSYFNNATLYNNSGELKLEIKLGKIYLNPGLYTLCVTIMSDRHGEVFYKCQNICQLKVNGDFVGHSPIQIQADWQAK